MTSDLRTGLIAGFTAYFIWGALPLYFRAVGHLEPSEILAHRILWSVPTGLAFIALARHWTALSTILTPRRIAWLALSAALIGANWLVYIYAVSVERVMEASIGYYINPLVHVLFGLVFFGERLRVAQWVSVGIACLGVAVMTIAFGRVPWIAVFLCFSFAFYGAIRKHIAVDGRAGFVVEAAILAPLAAIWLGWLVGSGQTGPIGNGTMSDLGLLILSGPITAIPLICFAIAAQRLKLSTIGMMQYLGPTLQFLIATVLFGEAFSMTHAIGFGFIWLALIVFTADSVLGTRKARRLARAAELR